MAEAIAILGVAAAALQFAETGYKVISRCSFLMKRSREYPDYLHRTHSQMKHLIYLAKVASDNRGTFEAVPSSQSENAVVEHTEQQPQSANDRSEPAAIIAIQMETIWKDCARQADVIDTILESMMREIEGRGLIGKWRQLSLHERVYNIERALGELERSKTTLGLWLGNESLYQMGRMHHELERMHNQIVHSERTFSRMFEEYQSKTENIVLAMIHQKPAKKALPADTQDKQTGDTVPRNDREKAPCGVAIQGRNSREAKPSATTQRGRDIYYTTALSPNVIKIVKWSRILTFAGNTIVLRHGSQNKKSLIFASKDAKNMFLDIYMRFRLAWLFDTIEVNFSFQQYPGNPSIGASLRTQIRVKSLPLETFFTKTYTSSQRHVKPSQEEQLHLFSVARKVLLESFHAGNAFPNTIDAQGRTLLHLQTDLYTPGYETFFTKMTNFLVSLNIDTEVVDDYFRTAQNTLCESLVLHDKRRKTFSHTVAAESRLSWTSFLEDETIKGETLGTFEVLQRIRYWPEAILDTKYEKICDIVLRKSIDDLRKLQEEPNLVQGDKKLFPLHFAAAASWPAGVETLISMGYSKFQVDNFGQSPLEIAVEVGCVPAVEALLKGDCLALFDQYTHGRYTGLPWPFREAARSDDSRLHDVIIECLLRHEFLLPGLLPYHDLVSEGYSVMEFAQKLFSVGFQKIDAYNQLGFTPLMVACMNGDIKIASFLLRHGADPLKYHEHITLLAGHFLYYDGIYTPMLAKRDGFRSKEDEKRLLEPAFNISANVISSCRCSPDGFTPITSLFQFMGDESTFYLKEYFQRMIRNIDCSLVDMKRHWRAFVVCETFNRLGMTHTCIKLNSPPQLFPDNRRIEIEDEEEELFFELEEIIARFDLFSENRIDDMSTCVDEFFDDLDWDLRPRRSGGGWIDRNPGCLGRGDSFYVDYYLSSRGELIKYNHKEIVEEESMLRWLFP